MMTALNTQPTNYVVAHESGHMLFGWPDLYGVGDYCIMANRGSNTNPVGINDAFRADQGWIPVRDVDKSTNAQFSSEPDGVVYRFSNPARPSEFFLWSNVQNTAEWVSLKGAGLLVWHFDKAIGSNTPPAPLELAVVQAAAGTRQLGATTWPSPGSAATDFFAAGRNATLSSTSKPSSQWNDGTPSSLRLYDISSSGMSMQFSVGNGPITEGGSSGVGSGGAAGSAGVSSGNGGSAAVAGAPGSAGRSSSGGSAGASSNGGAAGSATPANGGTAGSVLAAAGAFSTQPPLAGSGPGAGGSNALPGEPASDDGAACGCRLTPSPRGTSGAPLSLLASGLLWAAFRRRVRRA